MIVDYKIVNTERYSEDCHIQEDLYPNDPIPQIEEYTKHGKGMFVEYIKGGFFSEDTIVLADINSGEFIRVPAKNCLLSEREKKDNL